MSEWISIEDRLPDDDKNYYETVLVYCQYAACKECDVAYFNDYGDFIDEKHGQIVPVTHWQPLPQPPKVSK